jgi:hypothetical protein
MVGSVGDALRAALPPKIFWRLRDYTWAVGVYVPNLFIANFITRHPSVIWRSAHAEENPILAKAVSINVALPTRFCRIMTKHGSDKGRGWHNYTTVYSVIFDNYQDKHANIFELGLGTNNPALVSSMGTTGKPGASLRAWRELFPHAQIYGGDIDRDVLFNEERISTFYCDQTNDDSIDELWERVSPSEGLDIIIDDGLHTFFANCCFLEASLGKLNNSGIYVVEDIDDAYIGEWIQRLENKYQNDYSDYDFLLMRLPNKNNHRDNNILVVLRRQENPLPGAVGRTMTQDRAS